MNKIGIIVAMDKELDPIIDVLGDFDVALNIAGYRFMKKTLNGNCIYLASCGVGKTNSAIAAQLMIDKFEINSLISTGVAGAINDSLKCFDIVIADKTVHHDITPRFLEVYQPNSSEYITDKKMRETAISICPNAHVGLIASGDIYVATTEQRNAIIKMYSPLAVDMESASIGLCAYRNNIPYLSIRSISDNADEATTIDPDEFERIAAKQSADFILKFLNALDK